MSQHDMDIANAAGATFRADLNLALKAIASSHSGVAGPATPYAYQIFVDTSPLPGSNPILYIRNGANDAWVRWGYINKTTGQLIPDNATDASGFGSGVKMLFYQDTAPTGWVLLNTLDDKLLYVTKGSAAGGQTGGGVHSTGSWTISGITVTVDNHTLTIAEMPAHTHTVTACPAGPWGASAGYYGDDVPIVSSSTGGDGGHNHTGSNVSNGTWRPAAYCAIICERN